MNSQTAWIRIVGMMSGILLSSTGGVINPSMSHGQTLPEETSRLNSPTQSSLTQECPMDTTTAAEHLGAHLPNRPSLPMNTTLTVKDFQLVGNQVYSDRHLREYLAASLSLRSPYTVEDMVAIARQLQTVYTENGYLGIWTTVATSEPDTKDRLTIAILEGGLERIQITHPHSQTLLSVGYLCNHLRAIAQPLQQDQLNATLDQLREHPLITAIQSRLIPGSLPERQILQIEVIETQNSPQESIP